MQPTRAVLIAGPTASGKSALALELAQRVGKAWIINADSMQVYCDLRVLTARPTVEDEALAPHRLFGTIDANDAYSVARYIDDARDVLAAAEAAQCLPIIVGGTGLYFKALLEGLSPVPPIPDEVRRHWRAEATRLGSRDLYERLQQLDPTMADRLAPTDTQRITRAIEVIEATGRSLDDWQGEAGEPVIPEAQAVRIVLAPDRGAFVERCDARFDWMLEHGALAEAAGLRAAALAPDLPIMRAHGVRPLIDHLNGDIGIEAATERAKAETRQYGKRQLTWLKSKMITWNWLYTKETELITHEIIPSIKI